MKSVKTLKNATLTALSIASLCAGQQAFAHTTIQHNNGNSSSISVPATGSGTAYNNIVIGHTCEQANGSHIPVIAQSVLFPTVDPVITEGSTGTASTKKIEDLLQKSASDTTPVTSLANYFQLIQSTDVFSSQREKLDSAGAVIGFEGMKGKLDSTLHGLVPFRSNSVFFKASACVKALKVKIAIADICKLKFPNGGPVAGAANTWFPSKTVKFTKDLDGIGSPATMTFTNTSTSTTTTDSTCPNGYVDYTVTPSVADIDANMPIKKYWGK